MVAKATADLVEAAKQASEAASTVKTIHRKRTLSNAAKANLEARIKVAMLEEQLEKARQELLAGNKTHYNAKN